VAYENAGDPGPVTMRRLTNAEYDCTIRDLTGIDFALAKEFPADGGGRRRFFQHRRRALRQPATARQILGGRAPSFADQASILPGTGIVFHPQRVGLRGPDQLKAQAEQSLYVWYQHKAEPHLPTDDDDLRETDYMLACWKFKYRDQTGANFSRPTRPRDEAAARLPPELVESAQQARAQIAFSGSHACAVA